MAIDHRHVFGSALVFSVPGRTANIAEENRHLHALGLWTFPHACVWHLFELIFIHRQRVGIIALGHRRQPDAVYSVGPWSPGNKMRRMTLTGILPCLTKSS